ncbi:MAG: hypothetical protein AAGI14_01815 [Pseudomonadota bacterium]
MLKERGHLRLLISFYGATFLALLLGGPDSFLREILNEIGGNADGQEYTYATVTALCGVFFVALSTSLVNSVGKKLDKLGFVESIFVVAGYVGAYLFILYLTSAARLLN